MYTPIIEFASVVLFVGCVWHAIRYEGRAFAEQWFIAAYLFAILRETVMQVAFPSYFYAPRILRLGAAPALLSLLWGSLAYLAYVFARRLVPSQQRVPFAALVFLIAASLVLPIQATGVQSGWWWYEEPVPQAFGVPVTVPLIWGAAAVLLYVIFERLGRTRLPSRGRTYAMITFSPIIAVIHILFSLILAVLV